MKKSKFISLVLITAALVSCNRQEREEDGWYVDVNFNWPNYYNYRHWKRHRLSYARFHGGEVSVTLVMGMVDIHKGFNFKNIKLCNAFP